MEETDEQRAVYNLGVYEGWKRSEHDDLNGTDFDFERLGEWRANGSFLGPDLSDIRAAFIGGWIEGGRRYHAFLLADGTPRPSTPLHH